MKINFLLELNNIFETKNWKTKENYEDVFNSLSSLSEFLLEDESDYKLFIELLQRFHWISLNDYFNKCRDLLIQFIDNLEGRIFNLYVFPIIKKRHQNNVKSGSLMIYLIKAILPTIPKAKKFSFEDINTFDDLSKRKFTKSDTILLVDDFIGTGKTFISCINEIEGIDRNLISKISVLTIAISKSSLERISKKFPVYHNFEVLKGITDYSSGDEAKIKKEIMKRIEGKLFNNIQSLSLGYDESESLITLLRTPDNTFPIFWHEYKKRIKLTPPFPRYEKAY